MRCDTTAAVLPQLDPGFDPTTTCPVTASLQFLRRAAENSCGREVFCREGTRQVAQILTDIAAGRGESEDLELVEELCELTADTAGCDLATIATSHVLTLLRDHRDEWEQHLRRKRCTSLTCAMSFTIYVDPATCTADRVCTTICPEQAIGGGYGEIHVVDVEKCTKCLACVTACPTGAIRKAGPVKPRVPSAPVPVGSFGGDEGDGGMRRRRRRGE